MAETESLELVACNPTSVKLQHFNRKAVIPYGVQINHICDTMNGFISFLQMINERLHGSSMERFETMLMPANFSSIVGEFIGTTLPKNSVGIAKNRYHNGHPDLVPAGKFEDNSVQYAHDGIEVKASRYLKAWQGHNAENIWLMVFMFDANRAVDQATGVQPKPFRFLRVVGAQLKESDWKFAGRSEKSRRTITASVTDSGYRKMMTNWIYNSPELPIPSEQV